MRDSRARFMSFLLIGLAAAVPAVALEFRSGQLVEVAAGETVEGDLYASGETVSILGTVSGDLVAAGREVRVMGRVGGDLIAAGQAVVVDGSVGDDIRMAGMVLRLGEGAEVADHIVSAGYALEAARGSTVGGSVLFNGSQALLDGEIEGGLTGAMGSLQIGGGIGGDADVEVGGGEGVPSFTIRFFPVPVPIPELTPGLTVTDAAIIGGSLSYRSRQEAAVASGAVIGGGTEWRDISVEEPPPGEPSSEEAGAAPEEEPPSWGERLAPHVKRMASLLVVGLLLVGLAPRWLQGRLGFLASRPLAALGLGILTYLAGPLAGLVLLVATVLTTVLLAVGGLGGLAAMTAVLGLLAVALLAAAYLVALLWLGPVLACLSAGRWLLSRAGAPRAAGRLVPLLVGVVLYVLLRAVPVLGIFVGLIVMLFGIGALGRWVWAAGRAS